MKQMIIVLTGVMVFSGLALAAAYAGLSERIEENRIAALNASLAAIFDVDPDAEAGPTFDAIDGSDPLMYRGEAADGTIMGYAIRLQAQGYGGAISMLVGIDADAQRIIGISFVEQVETPGLGGRITEEAFRSQFRGLDVDRALELVRNVPPDPDRNEVQAITGATITSIAIVARINERLDAAVEFIERQGR